MIEIYNKNGTSLLSVAVSDDSYRLREIMGDNMLNLHISLPEYVNFPVGCYCIYDGARYSLYRPPQVRKIHNRSFEYTLDMYSDDHIAGMNMFLHVVAEYTTTESGGESVTAMTGDGGDGRLTFPLTATPKEHLQMLVDNLNKRLSSGEQLWTIGSCIDWDGTEDTGTEKLISYDYNTCREALTLMAETFETEYHFSGRSVSLGKLELQKGAPLQMSYGKGNGFKSGVGRHSSDTEPPIERLFVQGGEENIDPSQYGSRTLHLPQGQTVYYDGTYFYGQTGYDSSKAVAYTVSSDGRSVTRSDKEFTAVNEGSFDATAIYPKRVGTVSSVVVVDAGTNLYDIVDSGIPAALNYENCLIEGEAMTVIFQSGMLAGREFDVKYYHNAVVGKAARRFKIVPSEQDGETMPGGNYLPAVGDKYAVFHCHLPAAYICDNGTQTGAEWDALRKAVVYLHQHSEETYTFSGDVDGIWSKQNWQEIGPYMNPGYHILFSDDFMPSPGILLRITAIKEYVNAPHSPQLTLSNALVRNGLAAEFLGLHNMHIGSRKVNDRQFAEAMRYARTKISESDVTYDSSTGEISILGNTFRPLSPEQYTNLLSSFQAINRMMVAEGYLEQGYCTEEICYEDEKLPILGGRSTYPKNT